MKLSIKVGMVVTVLVITMIFFYIFALSTIKNHLIESRKHEIQSILTFSLSQVSHFVELEQTNQMSREEAEKNVIRVLSAVRDGNDFLWANDANGIARVHIKDNVIGVFQSSYAKYIEYLEKHDFMFVVGESEKANTNALFVKVNGMTLLPKWKWMIGMGVYVDELNVEANKLAFSFLFAIVVLFLVTFIGLMLLYRSVIKQLGDDPQNVMRMVERVDQEGGQQALNVTYPKHSLLFLLGNLYQYIHCIFESLRHQSGVIAEKSIGLMDVGKKVKNLTDELYQESKQISNVLAESKNQIHQAYAELTKSENYLDVVASRVADNIIINKSSEKEFKKIEASIHINADKLQEIEKKIQQLAEFLGVSKPHTDVAAVIDNNGSAKANSIMVDLSNDINLIKQSITQSGDDVGQLLESFCLQRASLESFAGHLVSVQQQLEEVANAKADLLRETTRQEDLPIDDILSSLATLTELIDDIKKSSEKMSYDLDCIKF
ncbi:cache domain-containing protein [Marinomonas shanghaiensis]|uniref:cache domain-containing protein n=1 Tax=Marinomonas shanghaiensis TaxID=2202418 RepID=UPI000DB8FF55|nr:cache domain-containing protein [Marinomonas shanghaiensis]